MMDNIQGSQRTTLWSPEELEELFYIRTTPQAVHNLFSEKFQSFKENTIEMLVFNSDIAREKSPPLKGRALLDRQSL